MKRSTQITICCDFHQRQIVEPSEHVGVASQIQDYIPLRQRLRRALDEGQTYTVYLHLPILAHWLRDLRDYGAEVVRWEEIKSQEEATFGEQKTSQSNGSYQSIGAQKAKDEELTGDKPSSSAFRESLVPEKEIQLESSQSLTPQPTEPDESWTTEAWLSWATGEYMPYFAWTIRNKQARERQIEFANRFADWLIKAYPDLAFDQNGPSLIFQQNEIHKRLTNHQSDVVLWLVIDGMTWWQAERLSSLYTEGGLLIKQMRPSLSALPSVTSISKRALAQGYLDGETTTPPMARLFESQLAKKVPHVSVYTQQQELESLLGTTLHPGIYLLLYNRLDRHNHESTGFTDDESVDGHLRLMARLTDDFFQTSRRQGLSAVAFVSSDHGSTLLPSEAPVLKVPSSGNASRLPSDSTYQYRKSRACAIEKTLRDEELSRLEADWYLLRRAHYHLPSDYLIPKGYAAVERRPRGWTHGGATPEETVVAFMELQAKAVEVMRPIRRLQVSAVDELFGEL